MYAPHIIRSRFHWPTALIVAGVFVVLAAAATYLAISSNQSPIPSSIRKQISFPVFIPTTDVTLVASSYELTGDHEALLFSGVLVDGQKITFSEESTPDPFNNIPNYMTQFLQTLYAYQAFDSLQGTVNLTHPKHDGQVAVMNSKGTLLFAKVARDEPASLWQSMFNHLMIDAQ